MESGQSYIITFGDETEYFIKAYCANNETVLSEAISRGLKLLKIAEDGKYRNEKLALIKKDEQGQYVLSEVIDGY